MTQKIWGSKNKKMTGPITNTNATVVDDGANSSKSLDNGEGVVVATATKTSKRRQSSLKKKWKKSFSSNNNNKEDPTEDPDNDDIPGPDLVLLETAFTRLEKAPENTRRVYGCVDIQATAQQVWETVTDYPHLDEFIPNLVGNDILQEFSAGKQEEEEEEESAKEEVQEKQDEDEGKEDEAESFETAYKTKKGVLIKQVGAAKVLGFTVTGTMTLQVREWPHSKTECGLANHCRRLTPNDKKQRGVFPHPITTLPNVPFQDVSMQNAVGYSGVMSSYHGVWRIQSIIDKEKEEEESDDSATTTQPPRTRLSYAAEVTPQPYVPVSFLEGQTESDLRANLQAMRERAEKRGVVV